MTNIDRRAEHLGWIEAAVRAVNPDLPRLALCVQSHYGPPDAVAFVAVCGVDDDCTRRRAIRAEAGELLRRLGYHVGLEPGRDVYDIQPDRARSSHDALDMIARLHAAMICNGGDRM